MDSHQHAEMRDRLFSEPDPNEFRCADCGKDSDAFASDEAGHWFCKPCCEKSEAA